LLDLISEIYVRLAYTICKTRSNKVTKRNNS